MVNLPPDQPTPTTPPEPRGNDRILEFDELLAVVLAFLGIGSILWWGLSRTQSGLADLGLLQRREGGEAAIATPDRDDPAEIFEPRTLERGDRPQREIPERVIRERPRAEVPSTIQPAPVPVVPVPVIPSTTTETTQPLDISDVPPTHWAYPFIKPMFDQGYLPDFLERGFRPDQPLTRAEMAALINRAFGDTSASADLTFSDVSSDYWAASAINNAVAQGFMVGYPDGEFRPNQTIPRYEVIVALVSGLGLAPVPAPEQTLQAFVDFSALPDWATPKVAAAFENNLIVNYPARDQIKPAQAATRAEIVAMLHQALVERGELPAVESEYTVP